MISISFSLFSAESQTATISRSNSDEAGGAHGRKAERKSELTHDFLSKFGQKRERVMRSGISPSTSREPAGRTPEYKHCVRVKVNEFPMTAACAARKVVAACHAAYGYSLMRPPMMRVRSSR